MTSPSVYDHYRTTDSDYPDGIYRVVGAGEGEVTLLRVGDADGRRINTGDVIAVGGEDLADFDRAENPDGNRPLGAAVRSQVEVVYWSIRVFVQQLAAHPIPTAVAFLFVLGGYFGERIAPLPDAASGGLILVGSLGLALVGSGRL